MEENMDIIFGNKISVEDFNNLRKSVGWGNGIETCIQNNRKCLIYNNSHF